MSSKDDKKIIVNSSDINQFKEMLDSFNNDLSQLNQKFIVISDCIYIVTATWATIISTRTNCCQIQNRQCTSRTLFN